MRRKCWCVVVLLCLLLLAGCSVPSESHSQQATSSPSPFATRAKVNTLAPMQQPTPDPTATPRPKPTATSKTHATPAVQGATSLTTQLQQQLFALINQDRANEGLRAYMLNNTMSNGAWQHSQKMAGCGLSHQCPGEPDPCQRVSNEGISWTSCGENVGYSSPNPTSWGGVQRIEQSMLNEQPPHDGHRQNLLSSSFHRVGIGIYVDGSGRVWVTEDFAS